MMSHARLLASTSRVLERSSVRWSARPSSHNEDLLRLVGGSGFRYRSHHVTATRSPNTSTFLFAKASLRARALSTRPEGSSPETSRNNETPPPTPAGTKSKPKIELRPGPVKSSQAADANGKIPIIPPLSSAKPHPTKPPPSSKAGLADAEKELLKEESQAGVIETAKKDIRDAAAHGVLAPPPPDASWAGRLYHQVKELFKFYFRGLKLVFAHRTLAQELRVRSRRDGTPLSWRDHRFVRTNNADLAKLVPFVLIILVLEEIIPLIVMYVPGMLPSTCVLPSQRARIAASRHERQRTALVLARSMRLFDGVPRDAVTLSSLNGEQLKVLCSALGISSMGLPRWSLTRRLRTLATEDALLLRERSLGNLTPDEIADALWDRGFLADTYNPKQQQAQLRQWLDSIASPAEGLSSLDARATLLVRTVRGADGR